MDPIDCLSQPPLSASRSVSRPPHVTSHDPHNHAGPSSSRSVTPSLAKEPRPPSRSSSVFSSFSSFASRVDKYKSEKLQKERYESALRLQTTWEALAEKYGSIPPEEDDEVDLRTGKIVKDRGRLRELEARDFGDLQEDREDLWEFDSDEDELGVWDVRSGLDQQFPKTSDVERSQWTKEDDEDLASFLRAEAARRRAQSDTLSEDDETYDSDTSGESSGRNDRGADGRATTGTSRVDALGLNDQTGSSSEDELAADLVLELPNSRPIPKPATPIHTATRRSTSRTILEVVIPTRSRPPLSFGPTLAKELSPEVTLSGLFTPPPSSPPIGSSQLEVAPAKRSQHKAPTPALRDLFSPSSPPASRIPLAGPSRTPRPVTQSCDACRAAGGERQKWAARCQGRVEPDECPFSLSSEGASHPQQWAEDEPTSPASPGPFRLVARTPERTPGRQRSHSIARTDNSRSTPLPKQIRHCVVCREAGGERAAASAECPGRRRRSECGHGKALPSSHSAPTLSVRASPSIKRSARTTSLSARRASRRIRDSEDDEVPDSPDSPRPALTRAGRGDTGLAARSGSIVNRPFTPLPSSETFRRGTTPLPRGATPLSTARLLYTPKGRSPRRCRYCYAAGGDRALEAEWCRGRTWAKNCPFYVQWEDTPAPSHLGSSLPPSSPPRASLPITGRRISSPALPRTPVSLDSNRQSSVSFGSSTKRKSILRQPSQSDLSRQASVAKRARFSLQPDLPSSDPFVSRPRDDDDELLLDSSSPAPYAMPTVGYSSSPYSREMVVRAADAGVILGVRPTGHLPESLLRTISMVPDPRTGPSKQAPPPTPPRSSGPSSSPVQSHPTTATMPKVYRTEPNRAKLMLPPPLPEKCYATPPLSSSSTSSRHRSRSVSLATPTPRPTTTKPRVHPATAPKARTATGPMQMPSAAIDDELEWGLDEDAGNSARLWRESSMVRYVQ